MVIIEIYIFMFLGWDNIYESFLVIWKEGSNGVRLLYCIIIIWIKSYIFFLNLNCCDIGKNMMVRILVFLFFFLLNMVYKVFILRDFRWYR